MNSSKGCVTLRPPESTSIERQQRCQALALDCIRLLEVESRRRAGDGTGRRNRNWSSTSESSHAMARAQPYRSVNAWAASHPTNTSPISSPALRIQDRMSFPSGRAFKPGAAMSARLAARPRPVAQRDVAAVHLRDVARDGQAQAGAAGLAAARLLQPVERLEHLSSSAPGMPGPSSRKRSDRHCAVSSTWMVTRLP